MIISHDRTGESHHRLRRTEANLLVTADRLQILAAV